MKKLLLPFLLLYLFACQSNAPTENLEDELPDITAIENGLLPRILVKGKTIETFTIKERMKHYNVPGMSIAVVQDGKLKWAKGYGIANTKTKKKVDNATMFQAGSISKPVAALAALKLAEEGKVDLDTDVNKYLKGWQIPETELTNEQKVTLRLLLTHSAGMTVHGFPGYSQTDEFPSVNSVLDGEGNTPKIFVDTKPDSIWRYSGGGYTVMEKVVEDVTGLPLEDYIANEFLSKMGMSNSTYNQPLTEEYHGNASAAYTSDGEIIDGLWHNYPEQAAAGLWTTPSDLAKYCIEIQEIVKGKTDGILQKATVDAMLTKHKNDWGLGPELGGKGEGLLFRHGGKNAGFTNNMIAYANQGNAVIVMTNADRGGSLNGEILRTIAKYYNWDIGFDVKEIEVVELEAEQLNWFAGKYILNQQVPDIGDYIVDVSIDGNKIVVEDPNNGEVDYIYPTSELEFMDISDGDYIKFDISEDTTGFLWNNRFQFYKMED